MCDPDTEHQRARHPDAPGIQDRETWALHLQDQSEEPCSALPGLTRPSPTLPCPALPRPAGRGSSPHPPLGAQHLRCPADAGPRLTMAASAPTARNHTEPATPVVLVTPARRPAPASRWARRRPLARVRHVICRRAHFLWPHAALRRGLTVLGLHTWSVPSSQPHLDALPTDR